MPHGEMPRTPSAGMWIVLAGAAVMTGVSAWAYIGPYRWIVDLQIRLSGGSYVQEISLLLTWLGMALPLWLVVALIGKHLSSQPTVDGSIDGDARDAATVAADGQATTHAADRRSQQHSAGKKPPSKPVIFSTIGLTIGGIILGIGAVLSWHGASLRGLTRVAVADLEAGKKPESGFLEIEGLALWDNAPSFKLQYSETYYCPLVSSDWRPPKPVAVYLASHHKLTRNPFDKSTPKFTGIRSLEGMPGPVRADFEKSDFKPAADFVLLSLGEKPADYILGGRILSMIGGGLALLGFLALMLIRLRRPPPAAVWR